MAKIIISAFFFIALISYHSTDKPPTDKSPIDKEVITKQVYELEEDTSPKIKIDTTVNYSEDFSDATSYEELEKATFDTSTLKGKRAFIMNALILELFPSGPDFHALFDLNFDGYDDYIIGYYGQAGTGIKNGVEVHLYHHKEKCYVRNKQLSSIRNPTFYIKQKKITGFYIGHGGGDGSKLEWVNGNWLITKEFQVSNNESKSIWYIDYPLENRKEELALPYQDIPPAEVLETDFKF